LIIILKYKDLWWGVSDWLYVAKDRETWQTFVNKLMELRVSQNAGIALLAEELRSSSRRKVLLS
jgi:hypothetical protein